MKTLITTALLMATLAIAGIVPGSHGTWLYAPGDLAAADTALNTAVDAIDLARVTTFEVQYALAPYQREIIDGLLGLDVLTQGRFGLRVFSLFVPALLPDRLGIFCGGANCAWRLAS